MRLGHLGFEEAATFGAYQSSSAARHELAIERLPEPILIIGGYGYGNVGDEAILAGLLAQARPAAKHRRQPGSGRDDVFTASRR